MELYVLQHKNAKTVKKQIFLRLIGAYNSKYA
jgi:hypothetical protein